MRISSGISAKNGKPSIGAQLKKKTYAIKSGKYSESIENAGSNPAKRGRVQKSTICLDLYFTGRNNQRNNHVSLGFRI